MTANRACLPLRAILGAFACALLLSAHAWACGSCTVPGSCDVDDHSAFAIGTYADDHVASEPAVSTTTLVSLITAGTPLALIDCRGSDDLAGPRIPGSMVFNTDSKTEDIARFFPAKDALIILYDGGSGTARIDVRKRLTEAGYVNVLHYPFGIQGWISAGCPTVPTASDSLIGFGETP